MQMFLERAPKDHLIACMETSRSPRVAPVGFIRVSSQLRLYQRYIRIINARKNGFLVMRRPSIWHSDVTWERNPFRGA
jgi:hypothetical protein